MKNYISRIILILIALESGLAARSILLAPSEAANARLFGLSVVRLMMLAAFLLAAILVFALFVLSLLKSDWYDRKEGKLRKQFADRRLMGWATLLAAFFVYAAVELAIYAGIVQEPVLQAVLMRLQPLWVWVAVILLEWIALTWTWYWRANRNDFFTDKLVRHALIIWAFFLLVAAFQQSGGYGFAEETADTGVFRLPGAPILGIQIILAVSVVFIARKWIWPRIANSQIESFLHTSSFIEQMLPGLLIWFIAFAAWMSVPLETSWFVDPPRPPNYTFSPNSDAYLYDTVGQSLLAGAGFRHPQWGVMVLRPVYSAILALFHWIGGAGYEDIIGLQVAFLALFPVLIFNLTALLYRRSAGVLAALLMILREYNAIRLADVITVSHAKLLMADLPAALGAVLVVLLFIRWMQSPDKRVYPLLAGGALGFFLLIRLETLVLFSLLVSAGIYLLPRHAAKWFQGVGLVVFGFVLFTAPWVWRNWQQTQMFYIISPDYEKKIVDRLFGTQLLPPPETTLAPAPVIASTPVEDSANSAMLDATLGQNAAVAPVEDHAWSAGEKLLHHFSNSQLQAFMIFPLSPRLLVAAATVGIERQTSSAANLCCSPEAYVRSLPYWWNGWDGSLSPESVISMGAILFLSAVGIFTLWRDKKFLGLVPILLSMAYFLFLALMGRSGGRWILEVDWVFVVVYSAGAVEICDRFTGWISPKRRLPTHTKPKSTPISIGNTYLVGGLILLIGWALPLGETLIPKPYTQSTLEAQLERLTTAETSPLSPADYERLQNILADPDIRIWYGRALYPRFYEANDGMVGLGGTYIQAYPRIEFFLVGSENHFTVLPQSSSAAIEHAADVLAIGKGDFRSAYFELWGAIFLDADGTTPQTVIWRDLANQE